MKNKLFLLFTVLVIFCSLINLTYQAQTAAEMRMFQMDILKGFQQFAEQVTTGGCKYFSFNY